MATKKKSVRKKAQPKTTTPKLAPKMTIGSGSSEKKDNRPVVRFHYIKSAAFRTVHVDGAYGAVTPQGNIQMSTFSERLPIPRETSHYMNENGSLGEELLDQKVSKVGVIRDVEINLVMNVEKAKSIVTWLQEKIVAAEKALKKKKLNVKAKDTKQRGRAIKKKAVRKLVVSKKA